MGDASLSIARLTPAHSGTYLCKVKKSPGVDTRKVSLVVMGKEAFSCTLGVGDRHVKLFMPVTFGNNGTVWFEGTQLDVQHTVLQKNNLFGLNLLDFNGNFNGLEKGNVNFIWWRKTEKLNLSLKSISDRTRDLRHTYSKMKAENTSWTGRTRTHILHHFHTYTK